MLAMFATHLNIVSYKIHKKTYIRLYEHKKQGKHNKDNKSLGCLPTNVKFKVVKLGFILRTFQLKKRGLNFHQGLEFPKPSFCVMSRTLLSFIQQHQMPRMIVSLIKIMFINIVWMGILTLLKFTQGINFHIIKLRKVLNFRTEIVILQSFHALVMLLMIIKSIFFSFCSVS